MKCRVCGNPNLVKVVDLGVQYLTGIFPHSVDDVISKGQLALVKCHALGGENVCSLLQLSESFDLDEMYGENYGYRSGLNPSMVRHLRSKVQRIMAFRALVAGDVVVDIGANDGTTLGFYPASIRRIGIDPTGMKFLKFYQEGVELIPSFFASDTLLKHTNNVKAQVVTSFSMFYDLESPVDFCRQIQEVLDPEGFWVFEQSYMPLMLEKNSFDTICHEHLEYYGLEQIVWILDMVNLKVVDVELNDVNGGSLSVTAAHKGSSYIVSPAVQALLDREKLLKTTTLEPYAQFNARILAAKEELNQFLRACKANGKRVGGLGASTKGNVLLQYLNLTKNEIEVVGEVNPEKFGCFTPGTNIPIIDEVDMIASDIDYFLVLPWHFREYFLTCGRYAGKTLVFPLPRLEIVTL